MYKNWTMLKTDLPQKQDEYSTVANWCNETGLYHIENQNGRYAVVKNSEQSVEEKKAKVRLTRDTYLQQYDFTQLDDAPVTAEEKAVYARYRQYLRDYTKEENWWKAEPKTYDEWASTLAEEN